MSEKNRYRKLAKTLNDQGALTVSMLDDEGDEEIAEMMETLIFQLAEAEETALILENWL
jgi:hypothetical protein